MSRGLPAGPDGFFDISPEPIGGPDVRLADQMLAEAVLRRLGPDASSGFSHGFERDGTPTASFIRIAPPARAGEVCISSPVEEPLVPQGARLGRRAAGSPARGAMGAARRAARSSHHDLGGETDGDGWT